MGLRLSIYRPADDEPGSALTDAVNFITVVNISGPNQPSAEAPPFNLTAHHYYTEIPVLYPADLDAYEHLRGPMAGSNYAGSSDSRWSEAVRKISGNRACSLVHIHDHFEVVE